MKNINKNSIRTINDERGSALVIAILVMLLMMAFVALAISRTTTEAIIASNDASEARTFAASEAGLEHTTRELADLFERKLSLSPNDVDQVKNSSVPGFDGFTFTPTITKTMDFTPITISGGTYSGLYAVRDAWQVESTATDKTTGVEIQLRRRFFSDRIPVFQFGMFYENDLELNRPPLFTFGGRVHTNGNLWVTASNVRQTDGIYFNSKVTAHGEIVNDVWKTGRALVPDIDDKGKVYINDSSGNQQELKTGEASVICVNPGGTNVFAADPHLPYCSENPDWNSKKDKFQGNLVNHASKLILPLTTLNLDLAELIRRGKNVGDLQNQNGSIVAVTSTTTDAEMISKERFANKAGLRISLADSQAKLPGCTGLAEGVSCGVRLDAPLGNSSIGYQPLAMTDGYQATALNATRMAMLNRQVWIKVEMMDYDSNLNVPVTTDITQDFLSLGVTEQAPIGADLQIDGYSSTTDSRSIVKLQRFAVPGPAIPNPSSSTYTSNYTIGGASNNLVVRYTDVTSSPATGCSFCTAKDSFAYPAPEPSAASSTGQEDGAHLKWANINNSGYNSAIVPFPIKMFDTREGLPNDDASAANANFGSDRVPSAGVMSIIDIDVANMRRFFNGSFDGLFPATTPFAIAKERSFRSTDVPNNAGWVIYVSDRRGDADFNGEYNMEDIFPDGVLQFNEDINLNGILNNDYGNEAPSFSTSVYRGQAATADHLYYRRGVRLINGSVLPGDYDVATPSNTKGFTVASENGLYVHGNYNVTGVGVSSSSAVTPTANYSPQNTATHIPAAIVADAIIILSNNWNDGRSFAYPFSTSSRPASDTAVRFAMIAGNNITGIDSFYQPSYFGQLNGGVHNLKRYLENWGQGTARLNYSGSMINLYNSHNNVGFTKCCNTVYAPPTRDWTFESSFQDPNRLPPGTPFLYAISFTGFQRVND